MRKDKETAIHLRKSGKSYNQIVKVLRIPKSTLAFWFKNVQWSQAIKSKLSEIAKEESRQRMIVLARQARQERIKMYNSYRLRAKTQYKEFKNDKLFMTGLMLYWGEGDSKLENGVIRITNTDPHMIKLFNIFLKKYFTDVYEKVKAYLILYPDLDDKECKKFWSKKIKIPYERFLKSHSNKGKHPTKRLSHGICTLFISSRRNKEVVNTWMELFKSEIDTMRV